jgi:O-antigen ligase
LKQSKEKWAIFLSIIFVFWSFISLVFSPINFLDGLFGLPGRHTGVLTYLFLSIYFIAILLNSNYIFSVKLIRILFFTASIAIAYGYIQSFGLDPVNWSSPPPAAFSFFGNQNFLSAFIGIVAVSGLGLLFSKSTKKELKFSILLFTILSLVLMSFTNSAQGYLIFIAGLAVILLIWLRLHEQLAKFFWLTFGFFILGGIVVISDLLQKTPWPSVLYEPSVSARGDFWRAALRMSVDNPIFGVGLDGFVDHYRLSRDLVATATRGTEISADSAHNIFLELLSGGGFPLLLIFICIVILVCKYSIQYIKNSENFDPIHSGLFAAWIAFMVQACISINQISLAITGWILSGALIGYQRQSENIVKSNNSKIGLKNFLVIFLAIIFGLGIGTPPMLVDAKFREAIANSDVDLLIDISDNWPMNSYRLSTIGGVLRLNGYPQEAIEVLRKGIEFNPNHFETWREFSLCPGITESEQSLAKSKLKVLDPFGFGAS